MTKKRKYSQEDRDKLYWRYKKKVAPTDEFASKNGPVRIIKTANKTVKTYIPEHIKQIMKEEL